MFTRLPAIYSQNVNKTKTINTGISQFGYPRSAIIISKHIALIYKISGNKVSLYKTEENRYYNYGIDLSNYLLTYGYKISFTNGENNRFYLWVYYSFLVEGIVLNLWSYITSLVYDSATYPPNYKIPESNKIEHNIALLCSLLLDIKLIFEYTDLKLIDNYSSHYNLEINNSYSSLSTEDNLLIRSDLIGYYNIAKSVDYLATSPIGDSLTLEADPVEIINCSNTVLSGFSNLLDLRLGNRLYYLSREVAYYGLTIGNYCKLDISRMIYSPFGLSLTYCELMINSVIFIDQLYTLLYCPLFLDDISFKDPIIEMVYCPLDVSGFLYV